MKIISLFILLLSLVPISKTTAQTTQCWKRLDLSFRVVDFSFINSDTGWIITKDKEILKTTDGGDTWTVINTFPVNLSFRHWKIEFVDESLGFLVPNHLTDTIYRTRDGGINWSPRTLESGSYLGYMDFVDKDVGYILNIDGLIFKTIDSGNNWRMIKTPSKKQGPLQFITRELGYFGIGFNTGLVKTIDGGESFEQIEVTHDFTNSGKISAPFFFINKDTGWLAAYVAPDTDNVSNQLLYKTENKGATWKEVASNDTLAMRTIFFLDENIGWLVGQDGTYKTMNGGVTWTEEFSSSNNAKIKPDNSKLKMFNESNGFLAAKTNDFFDLYRYQPCNPPNCVTSIIEFDHNEKGVSPETSISWDIPAGLIDGYILSIGTADGLSDIILDTVQSNTFVPEFPLPANTELFLSIIPLNRTGSPTCDFFAFTTEGDCLDNQAISQSINDSFCSGTSYHFRDTIITEPGNYAFTIKSTTGGCDSLFQLTLFHLTLPQKNVVDTLIEGDFYFWNDRPLEEGGTYIDTITAKEGCDTIVNLTLILKERETMLDSICIAKAREKMPNAINLESNYPENRQFDPVSIFETSGCPINPEKVKLSIYNRWGELIFQNKEAWNGQLGDGQKAPYDTYYYTFEAQKKM